MCRPGQIASFPLNAGISQTGLVIAFDFYPYPHGSDFQTIFTIRNTATNTLSLRCAYIQNTASLMIGISEGDTSFYPLDTTASSIPIQNGNIKIFSEGF